MDKEQWEKYVKEKVDGYTNRGDGVFDDVMGAYYAGCDFEEQSVSIELPTHKWQINERGGIHGGAIAGMFDTALGIVANLTAGDNEAATADMNISFIRPVEFGQHTVIKTYIVKKGRSLIRLRGEMHCKETGKLVATAVGTWIPL